MCGICGVIGTNDENVIINMVHSQSHRGPDDHGFKIFKNDCVAIGHSRLSILDLTSSGHQPMCDRDARYWITYNGEVYNYIDIKNELKSSGYQFISQTDTEMILYAYKEWDVNCLSKFNGMFSFAIWDTEKKILFCARDRVGIKPFYYYFNNKYFIFASEIKSIINTGLIDKQIDYYSLYTPALYQVSPSTGFKYIYKLESGNYIRYYNNKIEIEKYWDILPKEEDVTDSVAIKNLDELIKDSVKKQMLSDVPVGAFLSGGLDSSLIVALMSKNTSKAINTFTIKYALEDQKFEKMPDDSIYAKIVADIYKCKHQEFIIKPNIEELLPKMTWHLDEPLADPAAINTYIISKAARENGVIVLLNGMGGDEIFGGYRKQLACIISEYYQAFTPEFLRLICKTISENIPVATSNQGLRTLRWAKRFLSFSSLPPSMRYLAASALNKDTYNELYDNNNIMFINYLDTLYVKRHMEILDRNDLSYLTKICLNDSKIYLTDHNLTYTDKCAMAAGVETRPPLTDHRIVEFMFRLKPDMRIRRLKQKYLLKKVAEKYLPMTIINRPKAPFGSPLRSWIRGPLQEMISDYLSPRTIRQRGFYNYKYISEKIKRNRNGSEDNAELIWRLLSNEVWFRTFFP